MEPVKKIEIVTNSVELGKVLELLERVDVPGYSVIRNVIGKGDRGRASDDIEMTVLSNVYVMTVCTEEQVNKVVEAMRPILKRFGGVCLVSDAQSVVH